MIQIDPSDSVPIYRQVMDQVRLQIASGQLAPGDQLEPVNGLSARLRINPMTVSKAYGYLVEEGVVERRKGVGIFVAEVGPDQLAATRDDLLSGALRDAASLAIQLGVSPARAVKLLREHLDILSRTRKEDRP
jgi:GntR family transcriptional regulator